MVHKRCHKLIKKQCGEQVVRGTMDGFITFRNDICPVTIRKLACPSHRQPNLVMFRQRDLVFISYKIRLDTLLFPDTAAICCK